MSRTRVLVAGLGSPHGDDQAGWLVVEMLRSFPLPGSVYVEKIRTPLDVTDWLRQTESLHIIDACRLPVPDECIYRWSRPAGRRVPQACASSHGLSLDVTLDLAESLGLIPDQVVVWGVPGESFQPNAPPSREVVRRAHHCAVKVFCELSQSILVP